MLITIVRRALLGTLVALAIAASWTAGTAAAGLNVVASFTAKSPSSTSQPFRREPEAIDGRLLSISNSNAIALGAADWKSLIDLVHKAAAATARAAWTVVGSIKDVSKDVATLTVSSGPGLRFVITSARGGTSPISCPRRTSRAWKRRWPR